MEGARQVVAHAGHRHVIFLHRLQECGLGARARAVDLVRHQQLGEDGPLDEAEAALPVGALVEDLGAEDVRRHQVGRELDALAVEAEDGAHRLDELGLGEARHADEQAVAAGEHRHEGELDDVLLAEDDGADGAARPGHVVEGGLGGLDHGVVDGGRRLGHSGTVGAARHRQLSFCAPAGAVCIGDHVLFKPLEGGRRRFPAAPVLAIVVARTRLQAARAEMGRRCCGDTNT